MSGPDVRWEGVPHEQILTWVNDGPGPSLTERMEARLKSAAEALTETSDLVNTTLQRVTGGEWTGTAATVAAGAMQVLRDFDDTMHYRSTVSDITAFGQSDSAGWARTSVPAAVDVGPGPAPAGRPEDVLRNTEDYQDQQLARKEAEQRARQVMREYTAMTTDRVRSMPQLAPAPQVVLDVEDPDVAADGGAGPRDGGEPGPGGGGGTAPGGVAAGGGRVAGDQSGPAPGGAEGQVPPATTAPALAPRVVNPRSAAGITQASGAPEAAGATGQPAGGAVPLGAVAGPIGSAGPGGGRAGEPGRSGAGSRGGESGRPGASIQGGAGNRGGEPGGRPGAGRGEPGVRASEPGARTAQQSPHVRGATSPAGMAPVGTPIPRDDRERQLRYTVPSSAIFEPDEDDGRLRDPYHAGAHVPPPAIGAEDD